MIKQVTRKDIIGETVVKVVNEYGDEEYNHPLYWGEYKSFLKTPELYDPSELKCKCIALMIHQHLFVRNEIRKLFG